MSEHVIDLAALRARWPAGTRVVLAAHADAVVNYLRHVPLTTAGTVLFVDAAATIQVRWDNGLVRGVSLDEGDVIVPVEG